MILDVSYNNKAITEKINLRLGKPFTFRERITMRGIGSPKLILTDMSIQINNLMSLDNNRNVCNIEMRPKGIILGFRSLLNSYALIIPYYKLVLSKGRPEEYSIHKDNYFVKVQIRPSDKSASGFIKKLILAKNENVSGRIENL